MSPSSRSRSARLPRTRLAPALASACLLALPGLAAAEAGADASTKDLDTVVVTASGSQQWIKDAPASISV
ncbi:TonB-dependent receptor, partial [Salmonella sp. 3DZ2-4SM]